MTKFDAILRENAAKAARAYFKTDAKTRTTRANPSRHYTIRELAALHRTNSDTNMDPFQPAARLVCGTTTSTQTMARDKNGHYQGYPRF